MLKALCTLSSSTAAEAIVGHPGFAAAETLLCRKLGLSRQAGSYYRVSEDGTAPLSWSARSALINGFALASLRSAGEVR